MNKEPIDMADVLNKFSFPLISEYPNGMKIISGTTTFVHLGDNCYLINAYHTLERADSHANLEVVIPNGSRFCFSKEIVAKSIHDKNLDISITMIEKEWYPGFIGTRPVPLDDNLPDFNQSDLEVRLLFFGYPATRASLAAKTRTLVANPILYTSNEVEPPHDSRVYGEVRDFHIISDFNHKKVRNSKHPGMQWQAPNLEGMSGCPILKCHVRIGNNEDTPVGPIEFVGIATDKDKNKWLKGVKKEYIQNLLVSF